MKYHTKLRSCEIVCLIENILLHIFHSCESMPLEGIYKANGAIYHSFLSYKMNIAFVMWHYVNAVKNLIYSTPYIFHYYLRWLYTLKAHSASYIIYHCHIRLLATKIQFVTKQLWEQNGKQKKKDNTICVTPNEPSN